jgi:hypothetical protein
MAMPLHSPVRLYSEGFSVSSLDLIEPGYVEVVLQLVTYEIHIGCVPPNRVGVMKSTSDGLGAARWRRRPTSGHRVA